jgi:tRNA threonylcarbamoyladenosine biosynthesis protein TsaB
MSKNVEKIALAVETSGRAGSVAVGINGNIAAEATFSGAMKHSAELFTTAEHLLSGIGRTIQDVEHIYIAAGPGSFTGVRIAVTMAKMLAFSTDASIVAVNTMDALTENATACCEQTGISIDRLATIIDAKRGQFFVSKFFRADSGWSRQGQVALMTSAEFMESIAAGPEPIHLLGEGLVYYHEQFKAENVHILDEKYWPARAAGVFAVAAKKAASDQFTPPDELTPLYFRHPGAIEKSKRKQKK